MPTSGSTRSSFLSQLGPDSGDDRCQVPPDTPPPELFEALDAGVRLEDGPLPLQRRILLDLHVATDARIEAEIRVAVSIVW